VTKVMTKPGICRPTIACPPYLTAPEVADAERRSRNGTRPPWFPLTDFRYDIFIADWS
jgi:hypothetical protein